MHVNVISHVKISSDSVEKNLIKSIRQERDALGSSLRISFACSNIQVEFLTSEAVEKVGQPDGHSAVPLFQWIKTSFGELLLAAWIERNVQRHPLLKKNLNKAERHFYFYSVDTRRVCCCWLLSKRITHEWIIHSKKSRFVTHVMNLIWI